MAGAAASVVAGSDARRAAPQVVEDHEHGGRAMRMQRAEGREDAGSESLQRDQHCQRRGQRSDKRRAQRADAH
jgi:hypothetical protein